MFISPWLGIVIITISFCNQLSTILVPYFFFQQIIARKLSPACRFSTAIRHIYDKNRFHRYSSHYSKEKTASMNYMNLTLSLCRDCIKFFVMMRRQLSQSMRANIHLFWRTFSSNFAQTSGRYLCNVWPTNQKELHLQ